jgi:hypothetical protein
MQGALPVKRLGASLFFCPTQFGNFPLQHHITNSSQILHCEACNSKGPITSVLADGVIAVVHYVMSSPQVLQG